MSGRHFINTSRLLPETEHWPEPDRLAWEKATTVGRGPLQRAHRYRSSYSIRKLRGGYARWLRYLDDTGQFEPDQAPSARVTSGRLDAYFDHLQGTGNADFTIVSRFVELRDAMRMMHPGVDYRWITRLGGVTVRRLLPMRPARIVSPISSAVLLTWGEELFAQGLKSQRRRTRCTLVRDGVIIALLADRAPRLRALSGLQLGDSLKRSEAGWLLHQHDFLTKTRVASYIPVSDRVGHMLDRYVSIERLEMLGGQPALAAWARFGGPLTGEGIATMVQKRSLARFGRSFGPHSFRHCIGTIAASELSDHPFDGSVLLNHSSPSTTLRFYNRATGSAAAHRHTELLKKLRR